MKYRTRVFVVHNSVCVCLRGIIVVFTIETHRTDLTDYLGLAKTHWLREHAVVHIPGELMSPLQEALRLCSQLSHVIIRTLAHHECHSSHTVLDR